MVARERRPACFAPARLTRLGARHSSAEAGARRATRVTEKATKIVIITEKLIFDKVAQIIEEAGGTGYTVVAAGGKGSRGVRTPGRASVVDAFSNVKVEVIVSHRDIADKIADMVAERFFSDYSGITYLEEVEILRPYKF